MDLRTGCAYWMINDGLLASYPRLDRNLSADIAIIGAGITGASAAYALIQAGASVVVVDRRDVATGSSAASTGLLLYETDSSLLDLASLVGLEAGVRAYQLGRDAIDQIEATCQQLDDTCGFARRPCLYLASSRRDRAMLAKEHVIRRVHGFDADFLTADVVRARFGIRTHAALYSRNEAQIDSYRFTHRLLAAASRLGARVFDRTDVEKIRRVKGVLELVTADGAVISARRVICAGGYEATRGLPPQIADLNSTWASASEPLEGFPLRGERCLIWETARPYFYLRTTDDGRILIGGEDSRFSRRHTSKRLLQKKTATLFRRLHAMFPDLRAEPAYSWAGVFGETQDGLPCIGPIDNADIWYALGYGGNGITYAVVAANILRDAWTGTANPDSHLFRFDRPSLTGRKQSPEHGLQLTGGERSSP